MKKNYELSVFYTLAVLLTLTFCQTQIFAGKTDSIWQKVNESRIAKRGERMAIPEKYLVFRINQTNLQNALARIADEEILMEIPMPDGTTQQFRMRNAPVLSDELAADFPTWRNFAGEAVGDSSITGRFDWNVNGFHGYIFTPQGTVMIDPYQRNDKENYLVFYKHEFGAPTDEFYCNINHKMSEIVKGDFPSMTPQPTEFTFGSMTRTYRFAIATTGEWARNAAGYDGSQSPTQIRTAALGVINTTVGRLNGIYLREISSQFMIVNPSVENNAANIIFDDPATDPYNNTDQSEDSPGPPITIDQLRINRETINARLGEMNYDIGHLYGTGGGGVASSPSLCSTAKAEGYSARGNNTGDPFTVDYVAHEIGHQFGASHTYNQVDPSGTCTTRSMTNAFEVASGSTIMSYVGICGARNLQQYVDTGFPSFHIRSMTQMTTYLATAQGSSCGTLAGANNVPTVNAGAGFTIPALTPFTLTAAGADADAGDVANLLYSWEQYDQAPAGGSGTSGMPAGTYDVDTDGVQRPLFRAYSPVAGNSRTFPSMNFILNPANNDVAGSNQPQLTYTGTHPTNAPGAVCQTSVTCVVGERLPTITRTMNFRVSVRDRRGGIVDGGTTVTVAGGAGPFRVTAQDTLVEQLAPNWTANTPQTVTWDVANTNAAPVNAANVNILLSTDGGLTFPITLAANVPNAPGSATITVPNNPTTQARIKVEAVGNIFFDISNVNFTILAPVAANASISGRVLSADGRGVSRATVSVTDSNGNVRTISTSTFGYYRIEDLEVGVTYTFNISHKRYQFTPRIVTLGEDLNEFDFTAE